MTGNLSPRGEVYQLRAGDIVAIVLGVFQIVVTITAACVWRFVLRRDSGRRWR